ncbi:hypothetical protein VTN77DRAFT_3675 [Rasamsonia byssochlamydoides]|uniref:uncharacterized protein n=1 Tax=Rasamsonia byssochlamydoides TaxID=89139 RepID=UPI0037444CA5
MGGGDQFPPRSASPSPPANPSSLPSCSGYRYADPDARIFSGKYWIYPSLSLPYDQQTYFDCFSSPDLVSWTKHHRILDFADLPWSTGRAAWAPSVAFKNGFYYLYFSAGDGVGIGVARAESPAGPFVDILGRPLIGDVKFGAEPIDPMIFIDPDDGRNYLYYGGWGHGVVVELDDDMVSFKSEFVEITPPGYVEAPWMLKRGGVYYFMYSVGGVRDIPSTIPTEPCWTDNTYGVSYVTSTHSPMGPFTSTPTRILSPDPAGLIGQGTGSHSVLHIPPGAGTKDEYYYIVYHRRPIDEGAGANDRYVCIDRMDFDNEGNIVPVKITAEGVEARPLGDV